MIHFQLTSSNTKSCDSLNLTRETFLQGKWLGCLLVLNSTLSLVNCCQLLNWLIEGKLGRCIVHLDIYCKVPSLAKWQQDQFTAKWKTVNKTSIKYLHTSSNITMGIITLLEQVLFTSSRERKKIQFPILLRKSTNYLNLSVRYNIKISLIWQDLSKMGNDRYQICFGKTAQLLFCPANMQLTPKDTQGQYFFLAI